MNRRQSDANNNYFIKVMVLIYVAAQLWVAKSTHENTLTLASLEARFQEHFMEHFRARRE